MANIIKPKRRLIGTTAPLVGDLEDGEIAVVVDSQKVYMRVGSSVVEVANALASGSVEWNNVQNKPTAFPPVAHTHNANQIISGEFPTARIANSAVTNNKLADMSAATLKGRNSSSGPPEDLSVSTVRALLSINNVNNTSDADKPISTATQNALNGVVTILNPQNISGIKNFTNGIQSAGIRIVDTWTINVSANNLRIGNGIADIWINGSTNNFHTSSGTRYGGNTNPAVDNAYNLGGAALRWSVVFAGTGTINTSDARRKRNYRQLTSAEVRAALRIADEIGLYQLADSLDEKGEESARLHCGVYAQRAAEIMQSEGLDASRYAWFCFDEWDAEPAGVFTHPAELDENGDVVREPWDEEISPPIPAGNSYGIRYDQLCMFIEAARSIERASLLARVEALEAS